MKKTILYINPGPVYRPRLDSYQDEYRMLTSEFNGYIYTTSSVCEEIDIYDFKYRSIIGRKGWVSGFKFLLFCISNARKLANDKVKVDLVVTYDPLKTGLIGLIVARILNTKFSPRVNGVYTSPDEWVDDPASMSVFIKKRIYPLIMRIVLKRADGIKLLFKTQIDPFKNIIIGKVIRSFPNYVDIDSFKNIKEEKEVLFVGFPFKRKGADVMIAAFKKIADKYPDWKLKILGWYPDPSLLNLAIGVHPQIYHHKPVHHDEMPKQIGCCAILVLPSRSEAMGRVLIEAMAAGKPRIGSDVDGIPTVINDGVDGLLVQPASTEDLAEKLDLLMSDESLRKKLGENGSARAVKEFNKDIYNKNAVKFYNEVINNKR